MPSPKRSKSEDATVTLRVITSLLTSDTSLPAHIPTIVSLLYTSPILESCNALAVTSDTNTQKRKSTGAGGDLGVLLHKFKTKISSLLQSKTPQARWSGVVLAKASIESSFECLASHGGVWVRLLVPILARPEPPATHKLVIATLTRTFTVLTTDKPTLIREIVVPNIPTTIGHLLNFYALSDPSSSVSEVEGLTHVLEALRDIVQFHPITFRPFVQKTHTLILSVLSSPPSCGEGERLAREIFALLHLCASGSSRGTLTDAGPSLTTSGNKASAVADEWTRNFKAISQDAHSTLNVLFRCVLEDNDYSRSGDFIGQTNGRETTMEATGSSVLGLADWKGILEGVERVNMLLRLLQSFFTHPSAAQVSVPIGQLIILVTRILRVAPSTTQINTTVERAERELVFAKISELHRSALDLVSNVVERLGGLFAPFAFLIIEQVAYVFSEGSSNAEIRVGVYRLLNSLLDKFGTGLAKVTVRSIHPVLMTICDDILPPPPLAATTNLAIRLGKQQKKAYGNTSGQSFHADSFLSVFPTVKFTLPGLTSAAKILLATALAKLPTAYVRSELRTKMDRTAVLTENTEAMLASVLFPPAGARRGGGILPHLVGSGSGNYLMVEGVVRPRLPIVWIGKKGEDREDEDEDDKMWGVEENEDEGEVESEAEAEVCVPGLSKNAYTEETLPGESPYKRQKTASLSTTEEQVGSVYGATSLKERISLSEHSTYPRKLVDRNLESGTHPLVTEVSTRAASVTTLSNSSSFPLAAVVSSTSATESLEIKPKKFEMKKATEFDGGDSDDDMEVPEIILGESSSEDEGEGEDAV